MRYVAGTVDIAFAVKNDLIAEVESKFPWIKNDANKIISNEEGKLYVLKDYEWNFSSRTEADEWNDWLWNQDGEEYLLLVGYHKHPNHCSGDMGCWRDNPWKIAKKISVSIEIEEIDETDVDYVFSE